MKVTRTRRWLLVFVALMLFQASVLAGEYLMAVYPRWTGEEIRLRVRPVDPRSLFRGNYALLNYDLNRLPAGLAEEAFRPADVVYVRLKEGEQGYWTADAILAEPEGDALYLRGRVRSVSAGYRLHYGIEAWFAPKTKALALEKALRDGGTAVIRVADSGRAALIEVKP